MAKVYERRLRSRPDNTGRVKSESYIIWSKTEADEQGTRYESNWRDKLRAGEDLTGQNILTDDLHVAPVISCRHHTYKNGGKAHFVRLPWGHVSHVARCRVGEKTGVSTSALKKRYAKIKDYQIKAFVAFLALTEDPLDAVRKVFNLDMLVDRRWFYNRLMEDERTLEAATDVVGDVFRKAGVKAEDVVREGWKLITGERKCPPAVRAGLIKDYLDRLSVVPEKDEDRGFELPIAGIIGQGVDPRVLEDMRTRTANYRITDGGADNNAGERKSEPGAEGETLSPPSGAVPRTLPAQSPKKEGEKS